MRALDEDGVVEKLRRRCHGTTQLLVAKDLGISQSYLSDILRRHRPPSDKILRKLGLRRAYLPLI